MKKTSRNITGAAIHAAAALLIAVSLATAHTALAADGGGYERKMSVRITSPRSGARVTGEVEVTWAVLDTGRPESTSPPVDVTAAFYIDSKFAGTSDSPAQPFILDTSSLEPGKHMLTLNAHDSEGRLATHTVWIVVKKR